MPELERIVTSRGRRFRLRVERSSSSADYARYEALRQEIWGFPEDHLAGTRNMMCESFWHEGGSLFLAAEEERPGGGFGGEGKGELPAAFSYGFVGVADKAAGYRAPGNLRFYSQYTGVRPGLEGFGLGVALKEFQREIVRDVFGVPVIVCTYDPLTAVNALRNVRYFGMTVLEYRVATYGEYGGRLNRTDVFTDRFFMSWELGPEPPRRRGPLDPDLAAAPRVLAVETARVRGRSGPLDLESPLAFDDAADGPALLLRIPSDFYRMLRETDVPDGEVRRIPVDWRLTARRAFQVLLGRGFRVDDFGSLADSPAEAYYVLRRG